MRILAWTLLFLLLVYFSFAQQAKLDGITGKIQGNILEVKTGDETYSQAITFPKPGVVNYSYTETDKKGNATDYAFEFNLADIDEYSIKEETKGDLIMVVLTVSDKQKLVRAFENGEVEGFENQVKIISQNITNARAMADLIKSGIPVARKAMEDRLSLDGYVAMIDWLTFNVKEVKLNEDRVKQEIEKGEFPASLVFIKTEVDPKSSTEEKYTFNLTDLNPASVKFHISGIAVGVEVETLKRANIIEFSKNKEVANFEDKLLILANDIEEARDIKMVLGKMITAAPEEVKNILPSCKTKTDALASVAKYVSTVNYGEDRLQQEFTPQCITSIKTVETKGNSSRNIDYSLNLLDINTAALEYKVSGKEMFIEIEINDADKLISKYENGTLDRFENKLKLYVQNIEVARRLGQALKKATDFCKNDYKKPFDNSATAIREWIFANVGDVTRDGVIYKQQMDLAGDEKKDKIKFNKSENDGKKTVEEVFEFNMSDINAGKIAYNIHGNQLSVHIETKGKNRIIKYYKDGEVQKYAYEIEVEFDDIEEARNFIAGIKLLIENL